MRQQVVASLVAAAIGLAFATAAGAAALDRGQRAVVDVRTGAQVNVRAQPEIAANNIVAKAQVGTIVQVLGSATRGGQLWYRVQALDGTFTGWIRGDLLKPQPQAEAPLSAAAAPATPAEEIGDQDPWAKVPPRAPAWTLQITEWLAAIDSCNAHSSASPIVVLNIRPLPMALVEIVLSDVSGRYWSCVLERKGGTPITWTPVPPPGAAPSVVFHRYASAPLTDSCHAVEPLGDERDGTVIGHLVYNLCR